MRSCDKCIHYDVCFIAQGLGAYEQPKNSDAMDCDNYLEKDIVETWFERYYDAQV